MGFLDKLKAGLGKTKNALMGQIDTVLKAFVKIDEDALEELANADGCVGISMAGMDKSELIPYVEAHGTLPRKTFSMGEAESKRYYLEMRKITL